ncbi:MAG TPA: hypothetical protein VK633_04575, partial [Verrucomicrobiae bacterium]|nr:hypothetical protein [Verrucomicrobiae bacterium]
MYPLVKAKSLIAGLVVAGSIAGAMAAEGLNKSGGEYRILPTLPGDQTLAQMSLGMDGGFLVTQDNSIDGNGLGIRARKFYGDLSASQYTFQVNAKHLGDQQNPRVALLKGGGAVFAWEGSTASGHRIFVRFLDQQDTFSSDEILGSSRAFGSQTDPALTVLNDGTVVLVWAEWDRDGNMDGIFGQRFTSAGIRSGGVFLVNQTTRLSQRVPAVTALENGNFVVGWITDENRHENSIDLYARIFGADATPLGNEFPVNSWKVKLVIDKLVEVAEVCANPFLTPIPGGFRAAWSERTSDGSLESWDVVTRAFSAEGEALSGEVVVNNTTKGDQFSPKIGTAGGKQLILWTSFGQDGADEGIYGRLLNATGGLE